MFKKINCRILVLGFVAVAACDEPASQDHAGDVSPQLQPTGPDEIASADALILRKQIVAWLECEECNEQQLANVVARGDEGVSTLAAVLHQGLSAARRERLRLELTLGYDELMAYTKAHPDEPAPELGRDAYVATYLANFEARYAARAALALGAIGTPRAREALELGATTESRADVQRVIRDALSTAK